MPLWRAERGVTVLFLAVSSAVKWKLCPNCERLFRTSSSTCTLQLRRLLGLTQTGEWLLHYTVVKLDHPVSEGTGKVQLFCMFEAGAVAPIRHLAMHF